MTEQRLREIELSLCDIPPDLRLNSDDCGRCSRFVQDVRDGEGLLQVLHDARWSAERFLRWTIEARKDIPDLLAEVRRLRAIALQRGQALADIEAGERSTRDVKCECAEFAREVLNRTQKGPGYE